MRPGMPILLEWQWSPFIDNKGKIDNKIYGIKDDWFDENKTMNEFNLAIIKNKEESSGNYDGFVGFCKNFEIVAREDGGYDCSTEIIAMGEVLEGLKSRSDGFRKTEEENVVEIDNMMMILSGMEDLGETHSGYVVRDKGRITTGISSPGGTLIQAFYNANIKTTKEIREELGIDQTVRTRKLSEEETKALTDQKDLTESFYKVTEPYYLWKGNPLSYSPRWINKYNPFTGFDPNKVKDVVRAKHSYVRWDHFCDLINRFVFPLTKPEDQDNPIVKLTYTKPKNGKYDTNIRAGGPSSFPDSYNETDLPFHPYLFPKDENIKHLRYVNNNDGQIIKEKNKDHASDVNKRIDVQALLNNSFDPNICLLPNQNYKEIQIQEKDEGRTFLKGDLTLSKIPFIDFFDKIWSDVNKACAGNHNFMLQTELERPERIRVIDLQVEPPDNIKPEELFEFKIQSNESVVRDFNFNTTIPNELSATIAVAAQAPTSVNDLDQVTFANFSKGIKSRFTSTEEKSTSSTTTSKKVDKKEVYDRDRQRYFENVVQLQRYAIRLAKGDHDDDETIDDKSFAEAVSLAKSTKQILFSLSQRNPINGKRLPIYPSRKSAVIPLKFSCLMDGISGIVITTQA